MDEIALVRARDRISGTPSADRAAAELELVLAQSRAQIEEMPVLVESALRESLHAEVLPVARHIAELRGLFNQANRRLERIEAELLAERKARLEDLALLIELVRSGWQAVDARLERLESQEPSSKDLGETSVERVPAADPEPSVDDLVGQAAAA